jgi:hypothetical protein
LITFLEVGHSVAERLDNTGELDSKGLGCLRREQIFALPLHEIYATGWSFALEPLMEGMIYTHPVQSECLPGVSGDHSETRK